MKTNEIAYVNEFPSKKNFLKSNFSGKLLGMSVLCLAGYAFYKVLPFLITFTENLFTLIGKVFVLLGYSVVLSIIIYIISNRKFRAGVSYFLNILIGKLVGVMTNLDKIAVLKISVQKMETKLELALEKITRLNASIKNLDSSIKENNEDIAENLKLLSVAKSDELSLEGLSTAINDSMESNARLNSFRGELIEMRNSLKEVYNANKSSVVQLNRRIIIMEREYRATSDGVLAARDSFRPLSSEEKNIFEEAYAKLVDEINYNKAAIETVLSSSQPAIEKYHLQKRVNLFSGQKYLEEIKSRGVEEMINSLTCKEPISLPASPEKE